MFEIFECYLNKAIKLVKEFWSGPDLESDRFLIWDGKEMFSNFWEAEENLKRVLKKWGLNKFVSSEKIEKWIYNKNTIEEQLFVNLNMLCGLLQPNMKKHDKAMKDVLEAYTSFYILSPQKKLRSQLPGEEMLLRKVAPLDWGRDHSKALALMKKLKFRKALKKFNRVFEYLLGKKTVWPDIYRHYTNKAVCHFSLGEKKVGKAMLDIALSLNPYYDFAKKELKRYKKGHYNNRALIRFRKKRPKKKNLFGDPGYQYYKFLKFYQINFAHKPEYPSSITAIEIPEKEKSKKGA